MKSPKKSISHGRSAVPASTAASGRTVLGKTTAPGVAAYVRVGATPSAANLRRDSDMQLAAIKDFAATLNWRVAKTFRDVSDSSELRPGLTRLLKACALEEFQVVIVTEQQRLGRTIAQVEAVLEELEAREVRVYDATGRPITLKGDGSKLTLESALHEFGLPQTRELAMARRAVGATRRGRASTGSMCSR